MLIYLTDELASGFEVDVALVVSIVIVDEFEVFVVLYFEPEGLFAFVVFVVFVVLVGIINIVDIVDFVDIEDFEDFGYFVDIVD